MIRPILPIALLLALHLVADGPRPPPWMDYTLAAPVASAARALAGAADGSARAGAAPADARFAPGAQGGRETAAFRRAEGTRRWAFPRDHGQHPDYRLEWWYYTGIVRTAAGRVFGYQVTFFRQGLAGADSARPSAWAVRSLYLAHAAVSDVDARRYLRTGRAGRDSLGLSGAAPDRHAVWLGAWRADPLPGDPHGVRIRLRSEAFSLELELATAPDGGRGPVHRGPVLHGNGGLDRKGAAPGQASWYYSLPRLATRGTLELDGQAHAVSGSTWMDHEFGTGQIAPELEGWDWLALRLDDGSDLMLYRLRRRDGTAAPESSGSLIAPDGKRTALSLGGEGGAEGQSGGAASEGTMVPGRTWHSPATGGDYPLEWRIDLPAQGLRLHVRPAFDAQEQTAGEGTPFAYWEGAVQAEGTRDGLPIRGEGYLELTGYGGELGGALR